MTSLHSAKHIQHQRHTDDAQISSNQMEERGKQKQQQASVPYRRTTLSKG